MKRYVVFSLICIALAMTCSGLVYGKQGSSEDIETLETIVVIGTRTDQSIEKIPANVSVIDEEDIINSNAKNVVDLLKSEEGVNVKDLLGNGKNAQVDLRSFGETGPYNTLVLVDGRRVNEIDLSGIDWTQIPLEQIERIELLRGTGTVLYGDNAAGGVINIITRTPSEELKFSAGFTSGSFERKKEQVSLSGGRGNLTSAIYASRDSTDGYRPSNRFESNDIGGKIVFDPADILTMNIAGSYHKDEYDLPGHLTEAQYLLNREMNANPLDQGNSEDSYIRTGFDIYLGKYGNALADFSYRKRKNEALFPDLSGIFPQGTQSYTETFSITPRYIMDNNILNRENTLIMGVDLYWAEQSMDSFGGFLVPLSTKTGMANTQRDTMGVYFNDELSLMENLIFTIGGRNERVKYAFNQKDLNEFPMAPLEAEVRKRENAYNTGLIFLYGDNSSVFIRVNRSIRFPLTDEVSYIDFNTWRIMAKSDLQAQKGQHYEMGVKHYITPYVHVSLTLFNAEIDNEIFYNPLIYSNENHPGTLRRGIETGVRAELLEGLMLFGNYSYVEATFEEDPYKGNDIPAIPENSVNLGFIVNNIFQGLVFSADYNYEGASYAISDQANAFEKVEQYYTIDAKFSYNWRSVKAFFGINNITDRKYAAYGVMDTFLTTRNFYPAPERNLTAGLELMF